MRACEETGRTFFLAKFLAVYMVCHIYILLQHHNYCGLIIIPGFKRAIQT